MNTVSFMYYLLSLFMMISLIFVMNENSPIIICFSLLFLSLFMSLFLSILSEYVWTMFLIFMIYLGGVLMLMFYTISIMKLENNKKKMKFSTLTLWLILFSLIWFSNLKSFKFYPIMENSSNLESHLSLLFSYSYKISIMMMTFLLMIMIIVVFLISKDKGSMRSKF